MSLAERYRQPAVPLADEPAWLTARRAQALDRFERFGLPDSRQEEWRFTDLRRLSQVFFPRAKPVPSAEVSSIVQAHRLPGAHLLVLVNGRFAHALSDPPFWDARTQFSPLSVDLSAFDIAAPPHGLEALNQALFTDGARLEIAGSDNDLYQILHVASSAEPATAQCRLHVRLAPNAKARVVEIWTGASGSQHWSGIGSQIHLGSGAALTHIKLMVEPEAALHTACQSVELDERADYSIALLVLGGGMGRHDLSVRHGAQSRYRCQAFYGLRDRQHFTLASRVEHSSLGATTDQMVRCVLEESAHGVFQGSIAVAKGGQKTDARQGSKALLLSDRARVDFKPELEIFADDVKCAHGATVGDLSADALFYLQARGLTLQQARAMLIEAFALETLDGIEDPLLHDMLEARLSLWLRQEDAP